MSVQDPVADMLTCIRNAQAVGQAYVQVKTSILKTAILTVLQEEGYIESFEALTLDSKKKVIRIKTKYYHGVSVIKKIKRVSRPGLRVYKKSVQLPSILSGMGIAIVSTCQGVMTEKAARAKNIGGEVLCTVE